jgi:hypothetical protein
VVILLDEIGKLAASDAKPLRIAFELLVEGVQVPAFHIIVVFFVVFFQDLVFLGGERSTSTMDRFLLRVHLGSRARAAVSGILSERIFSNLRKGFRYVLAWKMVLVVWNS